MLPYLDIIYIFISIVCYSAYIILIKGVSRKNILVSLFWIHTVTYVGFFCIYLFRKFILEHDLFAVEELIHEFTFINAPLYLLMGLSFLGSFLIFNILIINYPISRVLPFAKISMFFILIGYAILGDPFTWKSMLAASIVAVGALLAALDEMPWPNPIKPFLDVPKKLWIGILCESLLLTLNALITFFLTQKTTIDETIMESLKHVFPFSFHNPFYFNLGARFFIMITFFFYIYVIKEYREHFFKVLSEQGNYIFLLGILYLASAYAYQDAYLLTKDKDVLAALSKLSIPLVIFLSSYTLNEKIDAPQIIGSALIVAGGVISFLF
ncbi:MAG: hypothetical protein WDZ41_05340 [Candidatus Babeliales bacterium]